MSLSESLFILTWLPAILVSGQKTESKTNSPSEPWMKTMSSFSEILQRISGTEEQEMGGEWDDPDKVLQELKRIKPESQT